MPNFRGQTLMDLPHAIILRIAESLPLKDLPNLISTCKYLAAMKKDFYDERETVDMACFEPVTPKLCEQLIRRFGNAHLRKLSFQFDVKRWGNYDPETLDLILQRFLDNINPSTLQLRADLRSGSPRMLDILAHCYYLDKFLGSQPQLKELEVDVEFSLFKVPSTRGQRLDWHLLKPFVTMDCVQTNCPLLESYVTHMASYQSSHMNLLHLQMRFLQKCQRLRFVGFVFVLGTEELETYSRLRQPLALEQALFYLPGWQVSPQQRRLNSVRLRNLGAKMEKLKKAVVTFKRRGCLKDCEDLFTALPNVSSVYMRCEFNPRYPVYDIDELNGLFFGGVFGMLRPSVSRVTLWGVPEAEFENLFCVKGGVPLPTGVRELRVQLHWYSPSLDERRDRMVEEFLKNAAPHLNVYCIAGVPPVPASPLHLFISSDNLKSLENAKHLAENLLETIRLECFASRPPTYNVASAGSIAAPVTCSVPLQSSISPYQVSSYAASTVGVGPYAGVYPSSVVSYPQNHAPNLVSFPSANTYSLSSSLPQPGALDTATLTATDPYMNKLSTLRVYNAVPPPQQLLTENTEVKAETDKANETSAVSTTSVGDSTAGTLFSSTAAIGLPVITSSCVAPQPNLVCTGLYGTPGAVASTIHSHPSSPGLAFSFGQITSTSYPQVQQTQPAQSPHVAAVAPGTSYSGYGGIYPQATPLQQVALALQRPPPPMSIKPDSAHTASTPTKAQSTFNNGQSEKQPTQRRKFQELPVAAKEPPKDDQNSRQVTGSKPSDSSEEPRTKKLQLMPPPKNLSMGPPKGMPSSPPKSMPPPPSRSMPPPPPVSVRSMPDSKTGDTSHHGICEVSDTSVRLVEYGEEDDDDFSAFGASKVNATPYANGKPFWAP